MQKPCCCQKEKLKLLKTKGYPLQRIVLFSMAAYQFFILIKPLLTCYKTLKSFDSSTASVCSGEEPSHKIDE